MLVEIGTDVLLMLCERGGVSNLGRLVFFAAQGSIDGHGNEVAEVVFAASSEKAIF